MNMHIYFIHYCIIYLLELDHRLVELDSPLFLFWHPKERGCMNCWWLGRMFQPRGLLWTIKGHQWTIVLLELCILCICNFLLVDIPHHSTQIEQRVFACLFEPKALVLSLVADLLRPI